MSLQNANHWTGMVSKLSDKTQTSLLVSSSPKSSLTRLTLQGSVWGEEGVPTGNHHPEGEVETEHRELGSVLRPLVLDSIEGTIHSTSQYQPDNVCVDGRTVSQKIKVNLQQKDFKQRKRVGAETWTRQRSWGPQETRPHWVSVFLQYQYLYLYIQQRHKRL